MMELASYVCGRWIAGQGDGRRRSSTRRPKRRSRRRRPRASTSAQRSPSRATGAGRPCARMTFRAARRAAARDAQGHPREARRAARPRDRERRQHAQSTRSSTSTAPSARSRRTPTSRRSSGDAPRARRRRGGAARAKRAPLRAARVRRRATAWRCTSTRSTSPRGASARRRRARCSRACPSSPSRRRAPRCSRTAWCEILVEEKVLPEGALSLRVRLVGRPARSPRRAGRARVHRVERHGGDAPRRQGVHARIGARERRGRQPQRGRAGPRRRRTARSVMNLFVGDVVRDMTQKTGQKCTAIRRVYVPAAMVEAVLERLRERLVAVKVGDPSREDVGMGPVATAQQLRRRARGHRAAGIGGAKPCAAGRTPVEALGVAQGKGFFVAPTLLHASEPRRDDAAHTHEVFGPVATRHARTTDCGRTAATLRVVGRRRPGLERVQRRQGLRRGTSCSASRRSTGA